VDPKWQQYYHMLMELRDRFMQQQGQLMQEAAEEYSGPRRDPADVGTNLYDADWALGMASSDQEALYEIQEAINRIHDGTYGICELTGKPIPAERLKAIPWTRFTVKAEQELEATGQARRVRLGHLESMERENQDGDAGDDEGEGGQSPRRTAGET